MQKMVSFSMKKGGLLLGMCMIAMLFSGNMAFATETNSTSEAGLFTTWVVQPLSGLLDYFAVWFDGNYGLSVILLTVFLRLLLLPLMLNSLKKQRLMQPKMALILPEVQKISAQLKKTKEMDKQAKLRKQLLETYQKHGVSPMAPFGQILPMLLQFPILIGFYFAIKQSEEMANHSFWWFDLGSPSIVLALIAMAIYYLQGKISLQGLPQEQQQQMKFMIWLSPLMIGFISFTAPAALPLYWVTSAVFLVLQSLATKNLWKPKENESQSSKKGADA